MDAIADMYFDCNALDRLDENAKGPAAAEVNELNNPAEEIKMDKDLGVFEMSNAGDFATGSGNPDAAASGDAQKNTFDFDAYNGNGQ